MTESPDKTVLVVDDDHELRQTLAEVLEEAGFRVVTARNGLEGLERMHELRGPAVILLDLMMPRMSGYEFLDVVSRDGLDAPPIIVMTASTELPPDVHALRKPMRLSALLDAIGHYLG